MGGWVGEGVGVQKSTRHQPNTREAGDTHSEGVIGLVHGDAVHADLDGVPSRTVSGAVGEVQLDGLDRVNGGPVTGQDVRACSGKVARDCRFGGSLTDPGYQRAG